MKSPLYCLLFTFFILSVGVHGSFLEIGDRQYIIAAWGIEDGLPQNSVSSLIQTRDGYIWLGTQTGLVRFDGVGFRVYNRWNTAGLKSDYILCLYEDKSGALWVGTGGGGISRLKKGKWTVYTMGRGLSENTVRAIAGDKDNTLWIGTDNGLNRLKGEEIKTYTVEDGLSAYSVGSLLVDPDGTLWIGTIGGGLNRMKDGKLFVDFNLAGLAGDSFAGREIIVLHRDCSGAFWIGTDDGLYYVKKGIKKVFLAGNSIRAMLEDRGGALWVGTDGEGIYRLTTNANDIDISTPITTRRGFPDDFIYSLAQDREGNVWIGTYTAGLARLKQSQVRSITTQDGLPENRVHTLIQDHEGFLWVGSDRSGLAGIDLKNNRVMRTYTTADGLSGDKVRALCVDREKNLWVGTGAGLNRVNIAGGKFRVDVYTTDSGLSPGDITAVFQGRDGSLWIGTPKGLNRFKDGQFSLFGREAGLSDILIRAIGEDRAGNLLVGTGGGLFLFSPRDNRFRNFAAGFSSPGKSPGFNYDVLAFHEDGRGYLWVGTNGSGLLRIKRQPGQPGAYTLTSFTEADGLPNNYIFSISEDSSGNLWMSSYKGVFVLRSPGTSQRESHPPGFEPLTVVSFDEKEGMNSSECMMTGRPSAWKSKEGKLYIPTIKGIAVFDLDVKEKTAGITPIQPPPVVIEAVMVDNRSVLGDETEQRSFPAGIQVVEFYFAALSFSAPGKTRTWYKLEGFDREWQEASPKQKRMVFYVNLPAGDYCFNVIACDNRGAWNYEGARFKFRISVPFHKSPLFYGLILLLVVLPVGGAAGYAAYAAARKRRARAAEAEKPEPGEKYKTSALLPETVEQVLPQLVRLMGEEKIFLDPGLTLKKLSERLHVHYNHLSRIINERLGKSFNDYINGFRIAEAKKKLADPREARKTILEIAYDTGFYSKSVFNTAFKKFTGMTPSRYKKVHGA